jgi:competence protein ComEA
MMTRGTRLAGVCLGAALVASIALKSTVVAQSDEGKLPEGEGRDLVARACTECHGLVTVTEDRRTRAGWQDVVEEMAGLGAQVGDGDIEKVVEYLWRSFGRVNVNRASQQDIQDIADLSPSEAAAIVEYRTHEGEFHALEDLKKVPGLDFSKIEERKNKIAFSS